MSKNTLMLSEWADTRMVRRCASGYDWNTINDGEYLYFGNDQDASLYADGIGVKLIGILALTNDIDMSFSSTGVYDLILKTNVADALSIKDSAGDLIVFATTSGSQKITITPAVDITGQLTLGGVLKFGTYASGAAADSTGYITITDAGGTGRKLMVQA